MASQDHGIHSCKECVPEGNNYFQQTLGRRRSSSHKKRRRKIEAIEDQALTIQAMRNMKNSILKEPLIHLSIWIRNDDDMNEEAEGSRRSLLMKQIKISIQVSFHDIVLLCICLYSVDVLYMIGILHQ